MPDHKGFRTKSKLSIPHGVAGSASAAIANTVIVLTFCCSSTNRASGTHYLHLQGLKGQNHTPLTMKRRHSVNILGKQYNSGKVSHTKRSGSSKMPCVKMNFAKHKNLVNVNPS